ncbi:MAG: Rrf2 family transcriptional regulator [bacterium]|nr:MAG: Rrf2 family transcriptional regulator [bacterium]
MLLPKTGQFSPRAAQYYANANNKKYIAINNISQKLNIFFHFHTKILQTLTETGTMISFQKPLGGRMHSKHPQQISLYKIILTKDRVKNFQIFNLSNRPI